jgi:hypothetical protein
MSNSNLVHDDTGKVAFPTDPAETDSERDDELSPETAAGLIARAKDVLAGRVQPAVLVVPPQVEQFLQRELGEGKRRPTAEALRRITDRLCLEAHYGGRPVACTTTQAGTLAVLASGERQVEAVLRGLSEEEKPKVVIIDTGTALTRDEDTVSIHQE